MIIQCQKCLDVSRDFIVRLCEFYGRQKPTPVSPIWEGVSAAYQADLIQALDSSDIEKSKYLLENIFENNLVFGIGWPRIVANTHPEMWRDAWQKKLTRLAQSIGVIRLQNPEQPEETKQGDQEYWNSLVHQCEFSLGKPMDFKASGKLFGECIGGRCISIEMIESFAILGVIDRYQPDRQEVLEIGAGLGTLGQYLNGYSTSDLPVCSVMHAFLLASSMGEDCIWLCGEDYDEQPIRVLGPQPIQDSHLTNRTLDVVVNQNSMPEMPVSTMIDYLIWINGHLSKDGIFISINHESHNAGQVSVREYAKDILRLENRSMWWLRDGYVCEIWRRKQ